MCREYSSIPVSVYDQAWQPDHRHKWIESERLGCDLGHAAVKDWSRRHFKCSYRWCHWLHLTGRKWFQEFLASQFNSGMKLGHQIERQVIHCFWDGQENLAIFLSARMRLAHRVGASGALNTWHQRGPAESAREMSGALQHDGS